MRRTATAPPAALWCYARRRHLCAVIDDLKGETLAVGVLAGEAMRERQQPAPTRCGEGVAQDIGGKCRQEGVTEVVSIAAALSLSRPRQGACGCGGRESGVSSRVWNWNGTAQAIEAVFKDRKTPWKVERERQVGGPRARGRTHREFVDKLVPLLS